jgi:CubicO group peptidase (beta-lactamase class C family)
MWRWLRRRGGSALKFAPLLLGAAIAFAASARAVEPEDLESNLALAGSAKQLSLGEAMAALKVPAASLAVIDRDRIEFARAYGAATPETLFQAASLSKFVAAAGAMRLVDARSLVLDQDVNRALTTWKVPANQFDEDHPVTLRGLLSMTAGIGVPGFLGYEVGTPLPTLVQILEGVPPANSPPVTVIATPGSAYRYSGGGYEVAETLMAGAAERIPFPEAMKEIVFAPAGMSDSTFEQPLPARLEARAVAGHVGDGKELPGKWRVFPEHAASGLWSTPTDIANLMLLLGRAWRGESRLFLRPETAREMFSQQNGGPYGLGAAIVESEGVPLVMKRGQNVGYQAYLILLPASGQGMVVMANSDNGSTLAEALVRRAAELYGWPPFGALPD